MHRAVKNLARLLAASTLFVAGPALAQACHGGASFGQWLEGVKADAARAGVSARTLATLNGITPDPNVIAADRRQSVFAQDFLQFSDRMISGYRLNQGAALIKRHAALFQQIQQRYGVPAAVITAFWGLETDFGANLGNLPTLRSLATLAYDCRRPQLFRGELIAALKIIERGDLTADQMRGPFAGELGQVQFLPSHYYETAVDGDGDGRRDLMKSVPDVIASTAALLRKKGWAPNQPWLQEVRVSPNVPWDQADLAIRHPRSQWVRWGVTAANGSLPADGMPASLVLPMGRNGPAFLAYPNFHVFLEWNQSMVYSTTAAYYATRLAGAGKVARGNAPTLSLDQVKQLQQVLAKRGYNVGKIDGIIGAQTRAAVKDVQMKLGMPADSYPTAELLTRLRGG